MSGTAVPKLEQAYNELEEITPGWLTRTVRRLRKPEARPVRLLSGAALILGSFFAWLPILGLEMFPLGLLLLAEDIPFLRKPAGALMLWFVAAIKAVRAWFRRMWGRH
jgi:hypothetical protein